MPKKVRDICRPLKKKGFEEDASRDHRWFTFYYQGKKTSINTKISHGEKELHDGLLSVMARQMHLSKNDFEEFMECTLSEEKYAEKMKKEGYIR